MKAQELTVEQNKLRRRSDANALTSFEGAGEGRLRAIALRPGEKGIYIKPSEVAREPRTWCMGRDGT